MPNPIARRMRAKEAMIPSSGANLVGVDTMEEPGEELYLISHHPNEATAERAQRARKRKHPHEITHIYLPTTR